MHTSQELRSQSLQNSSINRSVVDGQAHDRSRLNTYVKDAGSDHLRGGGHIDTKTSIYVSDRSGENLGCNSATHHRKNLISSTSEDVSNSVLHRRGVVTVTEPAPHSISTTAAVQRKSIQNIDGQFSSQQSSQDRKSLSYMHRQGINSENLAQNAHTYSKKRGDSVLASVGGSFSGESESRNYGNISQTQRVTTSKTYNSSQISFGAEMSNKSVHSSYRKEFTPRPAGPCPAASIVTNQAPASFKHTRDTKSHKFYTSESSTSTSNK